MTAIELLNDLCGKRMVICDCIDSDNGKILRIYPNSFDRATISRANFYEYLFKMGLDTEHHYENIDNIAEPMTTKYTEIIGINMDFLLPMFDQAFNVGIDAAIQVIRGELYENVNEATDHWNKHHQSIISKLTELKKKP